jgi:hypothetical protein
MKSLVATVALAALGFAPVAVAHCDGTDHDAAKAAAEMQASAPVPPAQQAKAPAAAKQASAKVAKPTVKAKTSAPDQKVAANAVR